MKEGLKFMKRVIVLFCLLVILGGLSAGCSVPANNMSSAIEVKEQETKHETILLHSYPRNGIYYYYVSDFNIDTFKKPDEVKPANFSYQIFIYDKQIPQNQFGQRNEYNIEDDPGYLLDMLSAGIENNPIAYIHRNESEYEGVQTDACIFEPDNEQIRYLLNTETGKFVKQMKFNNGELGITSICNPNYVPGQDI